MTRRGVDAIVPITKEHGEIYDEYLAENLVRSRRNPEELKRLKGLLHACIDPTFAFPERREGPPPFPLGMMQRLKLVTDH